MIARAETLLFGHVFFSAQSLGTGLSLEHVVVGNCVSRKQFDCGVEFANNFQ